MLTTVYFLIFITVLVNGGSCEFFLSKLRLRASEDASAEASTPILGSRCASLGAHQPS